jgi:uncharacterized protein (TIGR02996 family)
MVESSRFFVAGAKLFCLPPADERMVCLGRHRVSHRLIESWVNTKHLGRFRAKVVYDPAVLERMGPRVWTEEGARDAARWLRGGDLAHERLLVESGMLPAILADRADDAPRLALSDWLMERGDPRGEYIRLACSPDETHAAAAKLLEDEHRLAWQGSLHGKLEGHAYRRGFLSMAILRFRRIDKVAEALFGLTPLEELRVRDATYPEADFVVRRAIAAGVPLIDLSGCRLTGEERGRLADAYGSRLAPHRR